MTLVTTRLETAVERGPDLAERYRQRWQVDTSLAPLKTTRRRAVLPCKTVPGVLQAWTLFALVDTLVRLVMGPSATRQHPGVERSRVLEARRWLGTPSTGSP